MTSKYKWGRKLIIFFLLSAGVAFAQDGNPAVYPYGGVLDSSRYKDWMKRVPLNFTKANFDSAQFDSQANFRRAQFNSIADFWWAKFFSLADFREAQFDSQANFFEVQFYRRAYFRRAKFDSETNFEGVQFFSSADFWGTQFFNRAYFDGAQFFSSADFREAQFDSIAIFEWIQFYNQADFGEAQFFSLADFMRVQFDSLANFGGVKFFSLADFGGTQFLSQADFSEAQFDNQADFSGAQFFSLADFSEAQFDSQADFSGAQFFSLADFRGARIDSIVDFRLATIKDTVFVGIENSSDIQRYDFKRAVLVPKGKQIISADTIRGIPEKTLKYSGTKILLYGPVDLKIQLEKFEFIQLCDTLNYYSKKDIISTLKDISFKEDKYKKERFELDYIFAKSTMYQKESPYYKRYSIFNPICWGKFIYYITMGLGYRPFRLAYWVLGIIIIFAILYFIKMREQINNYIFKDEKVEISRTKLKKAIESHRNISNTEMIINCLYFSSMLLFTFRLKKDILTFFEMKEKRFIVTEWVLGFIIYIAFLTLAKAGSILHTLKSLFIG